MSDEIMLRTNILVYADGKTSTADLAELLHLPEDIVGNEVELLEV